MNDDIISRLQEVPGGVAEDAIVEITNLKAENARLLGAMEMARDCLEDKDVIGARLTLTKTLGETK
jgi:hypothetical protein